MHPWSRVRYSRTALVARFGEPNAAKISKYFGIRTSPRQWTAALRQTGPKPHCKAAGFAGSERFRKMRERRWKS